MKSKNNKLIIQQLDKKLQILQPLKGVIQPQEGWITMIRKTLNMSLRQLGNRMSITPQSVGDIELREKEGTVTINTLRQAANGLEMQLVYAFIPKEESLEKMIERRAREMAIGIIQRTSLTMKLEDQENSKERLHDAAKEMTDQLLRELPKSLWD